MSMVHTKESLIVDVEDSLRVSLRNRNGRHSMCLCRRKECWKRWILASQLQTYVTPPPETNQMTTERKEDIFRWETDSNMSRRMTGAEFSSSLDIRNPPTLPTPIPSSYGSYPASSVTSSSQGKDAQATVQHDHVERGYLPIPFSLHCHGGRPLQHRQRNNLSGKMTLKTPDMSSCQPLMVCIELTPSAS